mgnify:FL=1
MKNSNNEDQNFIYFLDSKSSERTLIKGKIFDIDSYKENEGVSSLPRYIEDNDIILREQYLDLIKSVNKVTLFNKNIREFLTVKGGFSFWEMSPVNEQSIYSQPISLIIKALAIRRILERQDYDVVVIDVSNPNLSKVISLTCKKMGLRVQNRNNNLLIKIKEQFINNYIALMGKGFIYLLNVCIKQTTFTRNNELNFFEKAITFFSPLTHLKKRSGINNTYFNSELWDGLPELFIESKKKANWIHTFSPSGGIASRHEAKSLIDNFNKDKNFVHSLMGTNFYYKLVLKVIKQWLYFSFSYVRLRGIKKLIMTEDEVVNFWPLLKENIYQSFTGYRLAYNLFVFYGLEGLFSKLPRQDKCFYLYENQPWEKALLYFFRKYNNGNIFGVVHSTVRFWDMRHFHHSSKLINYDRNLTTLPDYFLLNGSYAKELYLESGIPEKRALDSEALRYREIINNQLIEKEENKEEAILLILDYSEAFSINMMKFIELYEKEYQRDLHYIVKPHVNSPIDLRDFEIKNAVISNDKIETLLHNPRKCICSNMTSAQIDALIMQSSVIVILDGKELNLSPLKGFEAASFVSTLEELDGALMNSPEMFKEEVASDFFFHDKKLTRWKKYI